MKRSRKFVLFVGNEQLLSNFRPLEVYELGLFLDHASSIGEARGVIRHGSRSYSLVVLDARQNHLAALEFCQELRRQGLKVACLGLPEEARECCPNPIPATIDLLAGIRGSLLPS